MWATMACCAGSFFARLLEQVQVKLRRRQDLLQVVVQDLRQLPALAVLRLRQLQGQFLELPGPVLQLRRPLGHFGLQGLGKAVQGFLGLALLRDVGVGAEPAHHFAVLILNRHRARNQ